MYVYITQDLVVYLGDYMYVYMYMFRRLYVHMYVIGDRLMVPTFVETITIYEWWQQQSVLRCYNLTGTDIITNNKTNRWCNLLEQVHEMAYEVTLTQQQVASHCLSTATPTSLHITWFPHFFHDFPWPPRIIFHDCATSSNSTPFCTHT